jgi:phosphoglycolate phosphatase
MEIMEQAGVERNEVLYVGDSGVDMQTGRNAGVDTVGVSWGFRPKSELESFSPMAIVDCADDLKKYVTAAK